MRTAFLILTSLMVLVGCASPSISPYITTCNQPLCNAVATPLDNTYKQTEGLDIIASPAIEFRVDNTLSKLSEQGNILFLISRDGWKLGSTTLSLADFGLENAGISINRFMEWVFLKDFKNLEDTKPDDVVLHAVRAFKEIGFEVSTPAYFKRDHLTVFYYLTDQLDTASERQIIIVDSRNHVTVTIIDLYGFSDDHFQQFISTLQSYKY